MAGTCCRINSHSRRPQQKGLGAVSDSSDERWMRWRPSMRAWPPGSERFALERFSSRDEAILADQLLSAVLREFGGQLELHQADH